MRNLLHHKQSKLRHLNPKILFPHDQIQSNPLPKRLTPLITPRKHEICFRSLKRDFLY
jgi:hypothetical protein